MRDGDQKEAAHRGEQIEEVVGQKWHMAGAQATARGVWVSNIPSEGTGNALSCAEMAVYLILACLRSQHAMAEAVAARRVGQPLGRTLAGKTVLVIGFGGIAKELLPRWPPGPPHTLNPTPHALNPLH